IGGAGRDARWLHGVHRVAAIDAVHGVIDRRMDVSHLDRATPGRVEGNPGPVVQIGDDVRADTCRQGQGEEDQADSPTWPAHELPHGPYCVRLGLLPKHETSFFSGAESLPVLRAPS